MQCVRITESASPRGPGNTLWIIEGKISDESAVLLENTYQELSPQDRKGLCLNLENVSFVDRKGAEVLLTMEREGVLIETLNLFLQELINRYR